MSTRTIRPRLEQGEDVETSHRSDFDCPFVDRQRRAAVLLERDAPGLEDRRLGVEDQPVEVEDDGPNGHPRVVTGGLEAVGRIDGARERDAAVGRDDLAGHPFEPAHRHDHLGDVFGRAEAAQRGAARGPLLVSGQPVGRTEHRRGGRARRDAVDPDAVRAELARRHPNERREAGLRHRVVAHQPFGEEAGHARDRDDRAT